jgi:hypothetical protein
LLYQLSRVIFQVRWNKFVEVDGKEEKPEGAVVAFLVPVPSEVRNSANQSPLNQSVMLSTSVARLHPEQQPNTRPLLHSAGY